MTHTLARRTLTTAVALALCAGLLGLVLGFGAGVWWGHEEWEWYVDILVQPKGELTPCDNTPVTPRQFAQPPSPY